MSATVTVLRNAFKQTGLPDLFFFFNDTATTEIYALSLHDALPIYYEASVEAGSLLLQADHMEAHRIQFGIGPLTRSEEHTSELQSRLHLVCRLLLEKKTMNALATGRVCARTLACPVSPHSSTPQAD